MADYPDISLLSELDTTTPAGTEDAAKLDDSIRQVKSFLTTYLAEAHGDDGSIKTGVVPSGAIVQGAVNGTDNNAGGAGDENEIAQGTVATPDLKDAAVSAAKLATDAVETAKIKDANVTEAKLADAAVTEAKIGTGAVTEAKLGTKAVTSTKIANDAATDANRAITADHIKDNAVTGSKILAAAVTAAKLGATSNNILFFRDGSTMRECQIGGVMSLGSVDVTTTPPTLKFAFSATGESGTLSLVYSLLQERKTSGTDAGGTTATTWTARGLILDEIQDASGLVYTAAGGLINTVIAGTYLFRIHVPFYSVGAVRTRLYNVNDSAVMRYGTNAVCGPGCSGVSVIEGTSTLIAGQVMRVDYYCEYAVATNGLGRAVGSGAGSEEVYMSAEFIKIG